MAKEQLILLSPSIEYENDILQFRDEVFKANDKDSFAGCSDLEEYSTVTDWLDSLEKQNKAETCPNGNVPSSTYIAVRISDNKIVGIIDLRHHIDHPVLGIWGGHMGYTVRPSERGKGYAKEMLRLNLENCKIKGIYKVLLTCNKNNTASEKVILANGGIYEKEINISGSIIKRYWITLEVK